MNNTPKTKLKGKMKKGKYILPKDPPGISDYRYWYNTQRIQYITNKEAATTEVKPFFDMLELWTRQGDPGDPEADPDYEGKMSTVVDAQMSEKVGATSLVFPAKLESNPEDAKAHAELFYKKLMALVIGLNVVGVVAEIAGLGQIETVMQGINNVIRTSGADRVASDVFHIPFEAGTLIPFRRQMMKTYQPLLPEAYRLALAASKAIITGTKYTDAMAEQGFSEEWAMMYRDENFAYPSGETLLRMYRRGTISAAYFRLALERSAIDLRYHGAIADLVNVIPPLPDLIRFAVREAFGKHTAEEQYPAYEALAGKMGLSKEFASNYWYAHWDRIALAQMYDNLYRGLWDEKKFMGMLRIKDVHPDDRQDILNVAYRAPSIREMGYGWDMGIYSREDVIRFRKMGGLSPEDSEKAADSLIEFRTAAETEAVRREYLWLFAHERITEEQFGAALDTLETPPQTKALWIARGQLQIQRYTKPEYAVEYRIVTSTEAKWAFVNGLKDEAWYRAKLKELDWNDERITIAVERAKAEMAPPVIEEEEVKFRNLTVTQIRNLWRLKKIPDTEVPGFLEAIGFSPEDSVMLAQSLMYTPPELATVRGLSRTDIARMYDMGIYTYLDMTRGFIELGYTPEDASLLTLYYRVNIMFPDLRAMYRNGWINADGLYSELLNLGMPEERAKEFAMTVVKVEKPVRVEKERDLTKSEIIKGWKKEVLTDTEAISLLMDLGYEEGEAAYLLAINAVVAAGHPDGYWDMKRVTEAYKKAQGLPYREIPPELPMWEQRVKEMKAEIEKLRAEEVPEEELSEKVILLNTSEGTYRKLMQEWLKGGEKQP